MAPSLKQAPCRAAASKRLRSTMRAAFRRQTAARMLHQPSATAAFSGSHGAERGQVNHVEAGGRGDNDRESGASVNESHPSPNVWALSCVAQAAEGR